jgi:hypothetical protein
MSDPTNVTDPGLTNVADEPSSAPPAGSPATPGADPTNVVDPGVTNVANEAFGGAPAQTSTSSQAGGAGTTTEVENEAPIGKGLPADVKVS